MCNDVAPIINVTNILNNFGFVVMNVFNRNDNVGLMQMVNGLGCFDNGVLGNGAYCFDWSRMNNCTSIVDVSNLFNDFGLMMMNMFDGDHDLSLMEMMNCLGSFDNSVLGNGTNCFDRSGVDNCTSIVNVSNLFYNLGLVVMNMFNRNNDFGFVEVMNCLDWFNNSILCNGILLFNWSGVNNRASVVNVSHLFDDVGLVMMDMFDRDDHFGFVEMMNGLHSFDNGVLGNGILLFYRSGVDNCSAIVDMADLFDDVGLVVMDMIDRDYHFSLVEMVNGLDRFDQSILMNGGCVAVIGDDGIPDNSVGGVDSVGVVRVGGGVGVVVVLSWHVKVIHVCEVCDGEIVCWWC